MMCLLATLITNRDGICDIYAYSTYGGGQIPRDAHGDLAFKAILNEPTARYTRQTYERTVMLLAGSFDDQ